MPNVALIYPRDDVLAADLKNGVTNRTATSHDCTIGTRSSGAVVVVPVPGGDHPGTDSTAWFAAAGSPDIAVVDAANADDALMWVDASADITVAVVVVRSSIPSISQAASALETLSAFSTSRVAVAAAHSDSPQLLAMLLDDATASSAAFFPLDHDLAITGVPAELPAEQLVVARDLLTRLNVLEGATR